VPQLTNPRQEALAQALALGKTQMTAYTEAGYLGKTTAAAFKACNQADVIVRKAELIRERHEIERKSTDLAIEKESITKGYVITRLKYVADRSIRGTKPVYTDGAITGWLPSNGDNIAAVRALEVLSRIGGFLIEKVEVGQPGDFARLSQEELDRELVLVGEAIGIAPEAIQRAIEGRVE